MFQVPKITTNLGKELYFVKLPNFLSVDCKPFDPETYEDEIEDEDNPDEEGMQFCIIGDTIICVDYYEDMYVHVGFTIINLTHEFVSRSRKIEAQS